DRCPVCTIDSITDVAVEATIEHVGPRFDCALGCLETRCIRSFCPREEDKAELAVSLKLRLGLQSLSLDIRVRKDLNEHNPAVANCEEVGECISSSHTDAFGENRVADRTEILDALDPRRFVRWALRFLFGIVIRKSGGCGRFSGRHQIEPSQL